MKRQLIFYATLISFLSFSKNKVIAKTENTKTFKGTINGEKITMQISNDRSIECDIKENYVKGWYYYDKNKIKIPVNGYIQDCDLKLYHFGKNQKEIAKKTEENQSRITIEDAYKNSKYKEELSFKICAPYDGKIKNFKGKLKTPSQTKTINIRSEYMYVGRDFEYFKLPNNKTIELRMIFRNKDGYGGNEFYSMTKDKKENRLIFKFQSVSNPNACGLCGASDGEEGYRFIYFDKNWKIKKIQAFFTESCLQDIYDAKIVKQTDSEIKYYIEKSRNVNFPYYLTINKANSSVLITVK